MGLRRLGDANQIFTLKLIWLLFAGTGSLWVAWIKANTIADRPFWDYDFSSTGSSLWRCIVKQREVARPFSTCQVRSGTSVLFWHDNWTGLGPLIHISGAIGPSITGLGSMITVSQAVSRGAWSIPRSRHPIILLLKACLPSLPTELNTSHPDVFLWLNSPDSPSSTFSSSMTWKSIHPDPPPVDWYSSAWNRLPTRDRLISWGMSVPPLRPLCGLGDETRNHLFFLCPYSLELWNKLFLTSSVTPPMAFEVCLIWLKSSSLNLYFKRQYTSCGKKGISEFIVHHLVWLFHFSKKYSLI